MAVTGRSGRIVALIGEIYRSAVEPERWNAVLEAVCDELDALGALMGYYDPDVEIGQTSAFVRLSPDLLELFHTEYVDNPWARGLMRCDPSIRGVLTDAVLPRGMLKRTPFYADILAPQGINSALATSFLRYGRGIGGLSLMYADGPTQVTREIQELNDLVASHVYRAFEVGHRLDLPTLRRKAAEEAIEYLRRAVLALDDAGRVRFMNAAAERIVSARDGLRVMSGYLVAEDGAANRALSAGLAWLRDFNEGRLSVNAPAVLAVPRPSGKRPYLLSIAPFRAANAWPMTSGPAALCFVTDPDADLRVSVAVLTRLFELTPAEGRVALGIAAGHGLPAVARSLGIRRTTARTHLQQVFDKTNVRTQAALAGLIVHLVRTLPLHATPDDDALDDS